MRDSGDFNRRRDEMRREHERFDRMFRWVFPLALLLGVVGAVVSIAFYAGAAAWLWSLVP